MGELFTNRQPGKALNLPTAGSAVAHGEGQEWQDSGSEGFWIKPLLEQDAPALKTWLMKVDPGAYSPLHAHQEIEQIYVLEGSFFDQDHTYGAGDFIVRAPGAMHTAGSKDGAVVLLFYS